MDTIGLITEGATLIWLGAAKIALALAAAICAAVLA